MFRASFFIFKKVHFWCYLIQERFFELKDLYIDVNRNNRNNFSIKLFRSICKQSLLLGDEKTLTG